MDDLIQANLELRAELEKANKNLSECQNEVKRLNTALDNCIDDSRMLKMALADQSDESKSIIHRLEESLEGAQAEIDGKVTKIFLLGSMCDELNLQLRNGINQVEEKDRYIKELNIQLEELIGVSEKVVISCLENRNRCV